VNVKVVPSERWGVVKLLRDVRPAGFGRARGIGGQGLGLISTRREIPSGYWKGSLRGKGSRDAGRDGEREEGRGGERKRGEREGDRRRKRRRKKRGRRRRDGGSGTGEREDGEKKDGQQRDGGGGRRRKRKRRTVRRRRDEREKPREGNGGRRTGAAKRGDANNRRHLGFCILSRAIAVIKGKRSERL